MCWVCWRKIRRRPAGAGGDDAVIEARVAELAAARANKDYAASDAIRAELGEQGVEVQISRDGVTWRRKMQLD
jgi:cysteinyl-tRNA synthetase